MPAPTLPAIQVGEARPIRDELDDLALARWDEDDGLQRELREWRPVPADLEGKLPVATRRED
jgi:hypothetical protein